MLLVDTVCSGELLCWPERMAVPATGKGLAVLVFEGTLIEGMLLSAFS